MTSLGVSQSREPQRLKPSSLGAPTAALKRCATQIQNPHPFAKSAKGWGTCKMEIPRAEAPRNDKYKCGSSIPPMLHRPCELLGGQRVEHIIFCEPGAAGLDHSVANLVHVRSVVGVGVDHDLHAQLFRAAQVTIAQIEPVRIGVQFDRYFLLRGGAQHRVEIETVSVAAKKNASGGMADDRRVGILDGFEQPVSHLQRRLIEMRMHAGDYDVHLLEN